MFRGPEFFGSTTVGERGQIVLPAKLRREFDIRQGQELLVLGMPRPGAGSEGRVMVLVKAEVLSKMLITMEEHQQSFRQLIEKSRNSSKSR